MFERTNAFTSRYSLIAAVSVGALLVGLGIIGDRLTGGAVQPHGYCLLWQPSMVGLFVASDAFIGFSYLAISASLIYLFRQVGRDIPFDWMVLAFGTFIFACGITHFMDIWTLWTTDYWLSISIRAITAVASVATAVMLPPLVPKILRIVNEARISAARKDQLAAANAASEKEILERKQAEKKFRSLLEAVPDALVIVDVEGNIILINAQTEVLFGYTREELLGKPVDILVPEHLRNNHVQHRAGYFRNPRTRPMGVGMELNGLRKDGTEFPVEISLSPLKIEGEIMVSSTIRDIAYRKKAEREIEELNTQLEAQITQLTAVNKELESFSYSVSHDLRAPLRAIDGFSLALIEDYSDLLDEQAHYYLSRVRNASQRMDELIEGLLNLSRLTRSEMQRQKVNLSAIAREIAADLQASQPERQVEFIIEDQLAVEGDYALIHNLLENLFRNAWKFTAQKPRVQIEFGATQQHDQTVYFVRDNGVGFDMAYADKLFSAFQRLHDVREFEGNGIGLATVQRIINRHGGQVWAEGKVQQGATFYFSL